MDDPTVDSPDQLQLDLFSVLDSQSNSEFKLANVDILSYNSGPNNVVKINGLTFTDPDAGDVTVTTEPLITNDDGELISGSITVSGSNNTSFTLNPSQTVANSFDVTNNSGDLEGVMDCSGV